MVKNKSRQASPATLDSDPPSTVRSEPTPTMVALPPTPPISNPSSTSSSSPGTSPGPSPGPNPRPPSAGRTGSQLKQPPGSQPVETSKGRPSDKGTPSRAPHRKGNSGRGNKKSQQSAPQKGNAPQASLKDPPILTPPPTTPQVPAPLPAPQAIPATSPHFQPIVPTTVSPTPGTTTAQPPSSPFRVETVTPIHQAPLSTRHPDVPSSFRTPPSQEQVPFPVTLPSYQCLMQRTPQTYDWLHNDLSLDQVPISSGSFNLPVDFLTTPFPQGMNLSGDCVQWLPLLGLTSWSHIYFHGQDFSVDSLMSNLSVDYYYHHKNDMRIFLSFGILRSRNIPFLTHVCPSSHWIPELINVLRINLTAQVFQQSEIFASQRIYATTHPQDVHSPTRILDKGGYITLLLLFQLLDLTNP